MGWTSVDKIYRPPVSLLKNPGFSQNPLRFNYRIGSKCICTELYVFFNIFSFDDIWPNIYIYIVSDISLKDTSVQKYIGQVSVQFISSPWPHSHSSLSLCSLAKHLDLPARIARIGWTLRSPFSHTFQQNLCSSLCGGMFRCWMKIGAVLFGILWAGFYRLTLASSETAKSLWTEKTKYFQCLRIVFFRSTVFCGYTLGLLNLKVKKSGKV